MDLSVVCLSVSAFLPCTGFGSSSREVLLCLTCWSKRSGSRFWAAQVEQEAVGEDAGGFSGRHSPSDGLPHVAQ